MRDKRPQYRPNESSLAELPGTLAFKKAHSLCIESNAYYEKERPPVGLSDGNVARLTVHKYLREFVGRAGHATLLRKDVAGPHRNDSKWH